ncbi:hypothetical protein IWW47_003734 [Coemansia sp. RSA 2052]|nr:hypothetical protein IWW47_003734 [Coemansia sp. RSA 2052]
MNVAEILEGAEDGADARALAAAKAGFLAGARQQLDELGVLWQRLPREDNTGQPRMPNADLISVSNPVLAEALASDERFDQIYVRTCEQAAQYYGESGRRRFARAMHGDVAQLLARRGQWDGAARLLRTLVPGDDGDGAALSAMDVAALERLAECERQLGNARQSLECAVRLIVQRSDRHEESAAMLGELCGALRPRSRVAGALFSAVGVAAVERSDTLCVAVRIRSRVAAAADRVAAVLACGGGDGDGSHRLEIEFSARDVGLARGETAVLLTADAASCAGRFTVAAVLVAIGGAEFVAAASAPLAVRLAEHPASPAVRLGPACVADAGSRALRVAVHTRATRVAPGMCIRLFDARAGTPLPVTRCGHAGFAVADGGALVASAAMDAGLSVEADVALGGDPLGPPITAVTTCALFSTPAGERRVFVGTASVDPAPALAVSAHAVALGGARVAVVLRAQCVADRLRLASLRAVAGDSALDFKAAAGAMRRGDVATAVCELAAADDAPEGLRLQGEARFAMPDDDDDDDDTFTLRTLRFDVACSSSAAAALAVAVRMTAASRFCRVLEPTPLAVRLRIVGPTAAHSSRRRPHRLRVTVAERNGGPACWLIAGATECQVAVGDADAEVCLEYSLVALAPGFLRLPDVVCTDAGEPGRLLHTLVDADYPTLCAVPSHGTVAAYSVPVVVRA